MMVANLYNLEEKYPYGITFVIGSIFFERFFNSGMITILTLYLVDILRFSETDATMFYHIYTMLGSFFPVIGGIIADSYIGKYRTILYLSIVYVLGATILTSASTPIFGDIDKRIFSLVGFAAIAIGAGCSSPCTLPFGGDQFHIPRHVRQLPMFFSISYFTVNASALISMYVTPILRHNFQCFGEENCFPLAFGVLTVALFLSLMVFFAGKEHYICKEPEGNVILDVIKCIIHALKKKLRSAEKRDHWLDFADDKFSKSLIADTKAAFQVLVLFLPMPVFWALYDQQGSSWKFQATRMNGSLGMFSIKPDQMQDINPLLIMVLIPLFDLVIYPWLARYRLLDRPLQRFSMGGLLAAASFYMSATLEIRLEETYPILPTPGTTQLRVFNGLDCDVTFHFPVRPEHGVIGALDALQLTDLPLTGIEEYELNFTTVQNCRSFPGKTFTGKIVLQGNTASSMFLHSSTGSLTAVQVPGFDEIDKTDLENPRLRVLHNVRPFHSELWLSQHKYHEVIPLSRDSVSTPYKTMVETGRYLARLGNRTVYTDIELGPAGIYTLVLHSSNNVTYGRLITVTPPNSVHMLWQLPQYITLTIAEIMFSVTGNEFSYTQAPDSMKSFISAAWAMTDAFGNLIVVIIARAQLFNSHALEFSLYAALMVCAMIVFMIISCHYQYYDPLKSVTGSSPSITTVSATQ